MADSFDTKVSETVSLILLLKSLAGQGFSAYFVFGIVSLWSEAGLITALWWESRRSLYHLCKAKPIVIRGRFV